MNKTQSACLVLKYCFINSLLDQSSCSWPFQRRIYTFAIAMFQCAFCCISLRLLMVKSQWNFYAQTLYSHFLLCKSRMLTYVLNTSFNYDYMTQLAVHFTFEEDIYTSVRWLLVVRLLIGNHTPCILFVFFNKPTKIHVKNHYLYLIENCLMAVFDDVKSLVFFV